MLKQFQCSFDSKISDCHCCFVNQNLSNFKLTIYFVLHIVNWIKKSYVYHQVVPLINKIIFVHCISLLYYGWLH